MRIMALSLLASLAACEVSDVDQDAPEPKPVVFEQPSNPRIASPLGADLAAEIARTAWAGYLQIDPSELPPIPDIRWFNFRREPGDSPCLYYSFTESKQPPYDGCVIGLYNYGHEQREDELHILRWAPGAWTTSIYETALAHEMLHWALKNGTGDANGKHDDPLWTHVGEVSELIYAAGL